jgi:hypothetical protein
LNCMSKQHFLHLSPAASRHPLPSGEGYFIFLIVLVAIAAPLMAHHNFPAEYDVDKPLYMDGRITSVKWQNPHVDVFNDVTDRQGKTVHWDVELTPPHHLINAGWKSDTFKPGMDVCVEGFPGKNGKPKFGSTAVVLKASGQIVKTPPGMWAPPGVHFTGTTSCSDRR